MSQEEWLEVFQHHEKQLEGNTNMLNSIRLAILALIAERIEDIENKISHSM
jgi:hypothetical protein